MKIEKATDLLMKNKWFGYSILFIVLAFLPLTYTAPFSDFLLLLSIAVLSIPALYIVIHKSYRTDDDLKNYLLMFIIYICWMLLMIFNSNLSKSTIIRIIQMFGCAFAFICGATIGFTDKQMKTARWIVKSIILLNGLVWLCKGVPLQNFSFLVSNPATYGTLLFCWILFLSVSKEKSVVDWLILGLSLLLLLASSSRASLIAILVLFAIVFSFKWIPTLAPNPRKNIRKSFLTALFIGCIVGCLVFIIAYAESADTQIGFWLNKLSLKFLGKNFYSGRHVLWHELIEAIKAKPFLGYGLDSLPRDICDTNLSSHNTFLQVALQTGIVGLALLINILVTICRKMISKNDPWFSVVGIACVVSIILHECFEACLVQNMLAAGLQMWFIMGLLINKSIVKKANNI